MRPITQSRVGESGTCFRSALASVLNLRESQVPDFPEANCDLGVDEFLKPRGLRYEEYPITNPAPSGYHFILGTSPRGGQHCVVGLNGKLAFDPHPQDGTGRGLAEPKSWGVLEPVGAQDHMTVSPVDGSLHYGDGGFKRWAAKRNGAAVKDALSGKRLNAVAERLYEKHDDIDDNLERQEWMRMSGPAVSAYAATHSDIAKLVAEVESLLAKAKLDDDHSYWQAKLQLAKSALKKAESLAKQGDYKLALATQEGALTLAHAVIDKMRNSGRSKGRDMADWGSAALMPMNYKKAAETARTNERLHRAEGNRVDKAKGSLKPEFREAAQAHYTAAGCWADIVNALKLRNDEGEEAAESLWGTAVRQSQKAELLTTKLGDVSKAQDSSPTARRARRARLHRALDRVLGTDTLKEEILKENVEKLGMPVGRKAWNEITPHEAAQLVRKSRGMSKEQFNRLWEIARKGHITPF